jgi:uncharacterized protein
MEEENGFIIRIRNLRNGIQSFNYHIEGNFFREFGNTQILDACLDAAVEVEKGSGWMKIQCAVRGTVTVECDRCLDDLVLPIDFKSNLAVKFAKTGENEEEESSDEMMILDPSDGEVDLKQYLYDYVCTNLPVQKIHKDGECNADMMAKLAGMSGVAEKSGKQEESVNSQFSGLKELLRSKENNKKNSNK